TEDDMDEEMYSQLNEEGQAAMLAINGCASYRFIEGGQPIPEALRPAVLAELAEEKDPHEITVGLEMQKKFTNAASVGRYKRRLARIEAIKTAAEGEREKAACLAEVLVASSQTGETLQLLNHRLLQASAIG